MPFEIDFIIAVARMTIMTTWMEKWAKYSDDLYAPRTIIALNGFLLPRHVSNNINGSNWLGLSHERKLSDAIIEGDLTT